VACIGEQRFGAYVRKYLDAVSAGDRVAASDYLNSISSKVYAADNWRQINLGFLRLLLLRLNERVLALLFWFVVLGPMGAVLYRSVAQLQGSTPTDDKSVMQEDIAGFQGDGYRDSTQRLKGIMDWLPVRLAALCFSMIGSFTDAMQQWRGDKQHHVDDWVVENNRLLLEVGIGALQLQDDYKDDAADLDVDEAGEHVLAARSLSKRTLLVWVTILALMTLIGWLG
jgi:membrane protein required for beta-lactamase induction